MKLFHFVPMTFLVFLAITSCKNKSATDKKADEIIKDVVRNSPGINAGKGSFSIDAPQNWSKTDTNFNGLQATMLFSPRESNSDDFSENVNVVTERVGEISLDDYMNKNLEIMKTQLTDFKSGSIEDIDVDGMKGKMVSYSTRMNGRDLAMRIYVTIKNHIAYAITCTALGGGFEKWEGQFKEAVNTFKVM